MLPKHVPSLDSGSPRAATHENPIWILIDLDQDPAIPQIIFISIIYVRLFQELKEYLTEFLLKFIKHFVFKSNQMANIVESHFRNHKFKIFIPISLVVQEKHLRKCVECQFSFMINI